MGHHIGSTGASFQTVSAHQQGEDSRPDAVEPCLEIGKLETRY